MTVTPMSGQRCSASATWRAISCFGHAGIMLERHRRDRIGALATAANAGEGHDRADIVAALRDQPLFGGDVEILALQADRRHIHPPVIGGKNAISRAPASSRVAACTWVRSIAARITFGLSNA